MSRMPKIMGVSSIVVGVLAIVIGFAVYWLVHTTLADQHITVSSDAPFLAGDEVDGPFSAYAEAMAINQHATEAGNGMTYAELGRDDPARDTVMDASFLQASLFTSVIAFGVAALIMALGAVMILLGLAIGELDRRTSGAAPLDLRAPAPQPEGMAMPQAPRQQV